MPEPYSLHVISHTHWDREWHLTHEQFRLRLVDLIDHLLELLASDPDFRYFHLDAQTIVLEDYLQIRPHRREALERYVREGRLLIGPWYQLNDEYLTSGESTVRSLLVGHQIAREYGEVMKIGYLPDQFGNISQMPQIFRGFGIDNCIFGRGRSLGPEDKLEFWWQAPDGSKVLTSHMAFWYNNAQHIPEDPEEAERYLKRLRDAMAPRAATRHLLLMNGVDHLEAQQTLSRALKGAAPRISPDLIFHSTLPKYVEAIAKESKGLRTVKGELRQDAGGSVLAGTLSSRMYLKQANERCQTLLERYAEPFSALAWAQGGTYDSDVLTYAWKLLMQNHPHDSICGCSIDQVHREMMPRFDRVRQVGEELTDRALSYLSGRVNTSAVEVLAGEGDRVSNLVVFNPLAWDRTDIVEATLDFPLGPLSREEPEVDRHRDVQGIALYASGDAPVPLTLLESRVAYRQVLSPVELPMVQAVRRFRVAFVARDVPALGYQTYKVLATRSPNAAEERSLMAGYSDLRAGDTTVQVHADGSISLQGEGTPRTFHTVNLLESEGDVGDEYRYVRPLQDRVVSSFLGHGGASVEQAGPVTVVRADVTGRVPASKSPDGQGRSEETVEVPVTIRVRVAEGVPRVEVETTVTNRAKDHRLRALFPTAPPGVEDLAQTSVAEGQYDVLERPLRPPAEWGPAAASFHPQQSWCAVSHGRHGLAVLNQGLPEYEVYSTPERPIALTLLRCVGTLSGGGDAPGAAATPEAQCQGTYTFRYAVLPFQGTWQKARVWRQAHAFAAPLRAVQVEEQDGDLPVSLSFLSLDPPELVLTALKRSESGDRLAARFYNITDRAVEGTLSLRGLVGAWRANLLEEPEEELPVTEGAVTLKVKGKQIVTLLLAVEGEESLRG